MSSLRSTLDDLATQFAESVLAAIRTASLDDLQAEAGGKRARGGGGQPDALRGGGKGRLARRSIADIEKTLDLVVALVKKSKTGMRAEDIRRQIGLDVREVPRVLKQGLKTKRLKATGNKRATTYSAR